MPSTGVTTHANQGVKFSKGGYFYHFFILGASVTSVVNSMLCVSLVLRKGGKGGKGRMIPRVIRGEGGKDI